MVTGLRKFVGWRMMKIIVAVVEGGLEGRNIVHEWKCVLVTVQSFDS